MRFSTIAATVFLAGCATTQQPKSLMPPSVPVPVEMQSLKSEAQPLVMQAAIQPITWMWDKGGYTSNAVFVVLTQTNITIPLVQWQTFFKTTSNSFQAYPTNEQRYFTLYGSNTVTQESAWCVKQNTVE